MSESDVSDSKHEECGDPGPRLGEARPGVLVVCGQGGYCWPWRRLQLGWEAGAGAAAGAGPRHLICSVTSDPG